MENATKALLIAGAILIVILIIGVGMMVFQGASGSIDAGIAQMSAQEITIFNQNFTNYEGPKVKGANVKQLIGNIITNNSTNQDIDGKIVSIDGDKKIDAKAADLKSDEMSVYRSEINTGATYTVTTQTNQKTGLVEKVTIKKNS